MYAQIAAAKTEAKKEAERTRRKLLNAESALVGEYDDCVVRLSGDGGSKEHAGGQGGHTGGQRQDERAGTESGEDVFSDWA
jgi:hypothetical protein